MTDIVQHDGHWFVTDGKTEIQLPGGNPLLANLWLASALIVQVYTDDCGANLDRCVDFYDQAKNIFVGVSQLCQDAARELQEQIDLDNLYRDDPNEPWYHK